jgi:hypothetical protein
MKIGNLDIPMLDGIPRATWNIGRRTVTRYFTVHYNGPAVPGAGNARIEKEQIRSDARYHMRPGALGAKSGGDGIQYHGGSLSDGNWLFRDIFDLLWHSANYTGNTQSISWHLPIGDNQKPSPRQIVDLYKAIRAFQQAFFIPTINVKKHLEWSNTACPGVHLSAVVSEFREQVVTTPIVYYKTKVNARIRERADTASRILGVVPAGTVFAVTRIIEDGKPYDNSPTYVERFDGGYHHMSTVTFYSNQH